jgi:hypothetical protein
VAPCCSGCRCDCSQCIPLRGQVRPRAKTRGSWTSPILSSLMKSHFRLCNYSGNFAGNIGRPEGGCGDRL